MLFDNSWDWAAPVGDGQGSLPNDYRTHNAGEQERSQLADPILVGVDGLSIFILLYRLVVPESGEAGRLIPPPRRMTG